MRSALRDPGRRRSTTEGPDALLCNPHRPKLRIQRCNDLGVDRGRYCFAQFGAGPFSTATCTDNSQPPTHDRNQQTKHRSPDCKNGRQRDLAETEHRRIWDLEPLQDEERAKPYQPCDHCQRQEALDSSEHGPPAWTLQRHLL